MINNCITSKIVLFFIIKKKKTFFAYNPTEYTHTHTSTMSNSKSETTFASKCYHLHTSMHTNLVTFTFVFKKLVSN